MGHIFCIMGKSSSGKDTIYKEILKKHKNELKTVVSYTTRPIRKGEKDGTEYFFIDDDKVKEFEKENKIIELREYNTIHGIWKYLTVNDDQIDLENNNYLLIGTLESFISLKKYFGSKNVKPIYIYVNNGERLERALKREKAQKNPKYKEMCRRFLADEDDFSEEKLKNEGISNYFENKDLSYTLNEISRYIAKEIK